VHQGVLPGLLWRGQAGRERVRGPLLSALALAPIPGKVGRMSTDAQWGRALWDFLREKLPGADLYMEIDTEDLLRLAQEHGRVRKVKYNPDLHGGGMCDAEPGQEIWWWGDKYDER
jgi:hypothetical protein